MAFGAADLPAVQRPRSDGGSIAKEEVYRAFIVSHSSVNELLMRDGALCDSVAIPRADLPGLHSAAGKCRPCLSASNMTSLAAKEAATVCSQPDLQPSIFEI